MSKYSKIFLVLAVVLIALLIFGLSVFIREYQDNNNIREGSNNNEEEIVFPPPEGELITVRGEINCLPKVGTGPQTLECALGLRSEAGSYYGLRNLFEVDPNYTYSQTELQVEVSGTLSNEEIFGPDGNRYDTVGIIYVTAITEI